MNPLKANLATLNHAQLTVKCLTGANGQLALFRVAVVNKQELVLSSKTLPLEELNAPPNKKHKTATSTHAQSIALCLNGLLSVHAARNAEEESNSELESLPKLLNSEELHVELHTNLVNATFKTALLTALWHHGEHGQNVTRHVEVDLLKEQESFNDHLLTVVFHVVKPLNVNSVMILHAQSIA